MASKNVNAVKFVENWAGKGDEKQALPKQAVNEIFRTQTTKENTKGNSRCSTKSI